MLQNKYRITPVNYSPLSTNLATNNIDLDRDTVIIILEQSYCRLEPRESQNYSIPQVALCIFYELLIRNFSAAY